MKGKNLQITSCKDIGSLFTQSQKSLFGFQRVCNIFRLVASEGSVSLCLLEIVSKTSHEKYFFWCSEDLSSLRSPPTSECRGRHSLTGEMLTAALTPIKRQDYDACLVQKM